MAAPPKSLLTVRRSRTDIQTEKRCEICDLTPDFDKDNFVIPKWRTVQLHIEEVILISLAVYFGIRIFKSKSKL